MRRVTRASWQRMSTPRRKGAVHATVSSACCVARAFTPHLAVPHDRFDGCECMMVMRDSRLSCRFPEAFSAHWEAHGSQWS